MFYLGVLIDFILYSLIYGLIIYVVYNVTCINDINTNIKKTNILLEQRSKDSKCIK